MPHQVSKERNRPFDDCNEVWLATLVVTGYLRAKLCNPCVYFICGEQNALDIVIHETHLVTPESISRMNLEV
jgi:hypothetical protein